MVDNNNKWPSATDPNPDPAFKPEEQHEKNQQRQGDNALSETQPHVNPHAADAPAPVSPVGAPSAPTSPQQAPAPVPPPPPPPAEKKK